MNAKALTVFLVFILWAQFSWRWYTKGIKGFYTDDVRISYATSEPEKPIENKAIKTFEHIKITAEKTTVFFPYKNADKHFKEQVREGLKTLAEDISRSDKQVIITGHTDAKGSEAYNLKLGLQRAQFLADVLIDMGVKEQSLTIRSFGESRPLAKADAPNAQALNRRVEIHLDKH